MRTVFFVLLYLLYSLPSFGIYVIYSKERVWLLFLIFWVLIISLAIVVRENQSAIVTGPVIN